MASRKRTVEIEVVADTGKAERKLKGVGGTAEQTGGRFKKAGDLIQIAMIAVAGSAVVDFANRAVASFSELEQSVGGTEAVFGSAGGVIDDFAEHSAESIGLAESEFRTATTSIGGQLKRMTGDVDFAADRSIFLTGVAADLAATYGGTTAEAVAALGSAFRGEADPAERFNLNLKASVVNAKAMELGLAASSTEVDENAKAQAILALITEQSADALGQFAREADTAAGKAQRLDARLEDLNAAIGERLTPTAVEGAEKTLTFFDVLDSDVDLGWSQRLSAALQLATGESAKSVQAYIEQKSALIEVGEATREAADEASELTDAEIGAREQIDLLADSTVTATEATKGAVPSTEALAAAQERAAGAAKHHREEIAKQREALRGVHDPVSRVWSLTKDLEEATNDAAEATRKHGAASDEAVEASLRVAGINADLEQTYLDLKKQGIDPTGAAARTMFQGLGVPDAVINEVFGVFNEWERDFENRRFRFRFEVPDISVADTKFTGGVFHQGGTVPGTGDKLALVEGGETIRTKEQEAALRSPHSGASTVNHNTFYGITPTSVQREIERARRGLR